MPGPMSLNCGYVAGQGLCRVVRSVRIEGVRGSNPLGSTQFDQLSGSGFASRSGLTPPVSDSGSTLGADLSLKLTDIVDIWGL